MQRSTWTSYTVELRLKLHTFLRLVFYYSSLINAVDEQVYRELWRVTWERVLLPEFSRTNVSERTRERVRKIVSDYLEGRTNRREMLKSFMKMFVTTRRHVVFNTEEFLREIGSRAVHVRS